MQHHHPQVSPRPRNGAKSRAVSLAEAGRLLGKHRNTLSAWLAEGAPAVQAARRGDGVEWKLDLGALLDWHTHRAVAAERQRLESKYTAENERLRRALEQGEGETSEPISRSEALRRKSVAEARLAEIDLAEREKSLLPKDEVQRVAVIVMTVTRDRLLAVPHRTAPELATENTAAGCGRIVAEAIHEALVELADLGAKVAAGDFTSPYDEAGPDDDPETEDETDAA